MAPQYDPAAAQARWYPTWVERGYFHADASSDKPAYCIVLPPPNVTGRLHMGHALNHTIQDILIRRARMRGFEALWVPGTDHAGIATQVVVERELRKEGIERRDMGRDAFLERVWAWKERYGGEILEQMKMLGDSCDWDRLRFTMDDGLSLAVRVAFVRLYEAGMIYRGERLVNWCPTDQTGLSDSEVEYEEVEGELVTFRYPLTAGDGHLEVATTRLETMLGDTGIAVNPSDERYTSLVGSTVTHPFDGREIPIVADRHVDASFGTGAVKVTPAHDPNDWEIAERAGLPRINIFDASAHVNEAAPERFRGLDRYEARIAVRAALEQQGLLVAEERPYLHSVGHCYRCHSEIEPWVAGRQWFVAVDELKQDARAAIDAGRIRFTPERWAKTSDSWLEGLRDWNISRQLWWGHRIPVWYCEEHHITAAIEDPTACAECGSTQIEQDPDVLDTWFSSQLWPFSVLGWPDEDAEDFKRFYPTTVLSTAYEILFLWVTRMMMSGLALAGDVPFAQVVIHGLVRDEHGKKMSKSIGNVIDPLTMIDRYGADALRFALARMASPDQQNLPLSEAAIEHGRNFANKIWNAARLVFNAGGKAELPEPSLRGPVERWLLSKSEACVEAVDAALETDDFDDAAQALYRFLWSEYCDWGLELAKHRLYEGTDAERAATADTLAWVLEGTLRLLHPFMPFVTEEIWQRFGLGDSIVVAEWPAEDPSLRDQAAEDEVAVVQGLTGDIRKLQAGLPVEFTKQVVVRDDLRSGVEPWREQLSRLASAEVTFAPLDGVRVDLVVPPDADTTEVVGRLTKKLAGIDKDLVAKGKKLANEGFMTKAAPEAVEKVRGDIAELEEERGVVEAQLRRFGA